MGTVLCLERYPVHPERVAEFEAVLQEMLDTAREQPGLLWADAGAALDDRPSYLALSEWRTAADLDAWESRPAFEELSERADPWLREGATRRRFGGGT